MTSPPLPDWVPTVEPGMRILVTGASGGLGFALVNMLLKGPDCVIGAHGSSKQVPLNDPRVHHFHQPFESAEDCETLINLFVAQVGGIDGLAVLSGGIHYSGHWNSMSAKDWHADIDLNLNTPFFLARAAMTHMKCNSNGGRILLTGTESSIHGGSARSFPYAVAKRGTECLVEGLAREGAANRILVNGVRFGFIDSGFHHRWHGVSKSELEERANLIPLKRGGHPDEAAALMIFLLSNWAQFVTGQMIPLTGGDWL